MLRRPARVTGWLVIVLASLGWVSTAQAEKERTVLRLWLTGAIGEAPGQFELGDLFAASKPRTLYDWVKTIRAAAKRDDIAGLVLIIDGPEVGLAQVEELRHAVQDFRATGKPVYAYLDSADNPSYLLATAADEITLAPFSSLDIIGLRGQMEFYKNLLDKIGVEADLLHCGDFKTAVEPFTRTAPSEPAKQQMNRLLDGLFARCLAMMAEGRKLETSAVEAAVDAAPLTADEALAHKMVDRVAGYPEFREMLRKHFGDDAKFIKSLDAKSDETPDLESPLGFFHFMQILADRRNRRQVRQR